MLQNRTSGFYLDNYLEELNVVNVCRCLSAAIVYLCYGEVTDFLLLLRYAWRYEGNGIRGERPVDTQQTSTQFNASNKYVV